MEKLEGVKEELTTCSTERLLYRQGYIQACVDFQEFFSEGKKE